MDLFRVSHRLGGTQTLIWERDVATVSAEFLARISAHGLDIPFVLTGLRSVDPNAIQHERPEPTLAARLQQESRRLNLSEAELARKAGQDPQALKQFESDALIPDAAALQQLHLAGVDIGYVLLSLRSTPPEADVQALLAHYGKATERTCAGERGGGVGWAGEVGWCHPNPQSPLCTLVCSGRPTFGTERLCTISPNFIGGGLW